jgi:hypothetical protein
MASLYQHVKYYKLTSKYSTFNPNHSNSNKFILNQGKFLESFKMDKSFLLTSWTIFLLVQIKKITFVVYLILRFGSLTWFSIFV